VQILELDDADVVMGGDGGGSGSGGYFMPVMGFSGSGSHGDSDYRGQAYGRRVGGGGWAY
jgi:hypothetical protein